MDGILASTDLASSFAPAAQALYGMAYLPVVIFLLAIAFRAKPAKAARAALSVGIAFVGVVVVISMFWAVLGDVAQAIAVRTGIERDVIDLGWPTAATIAFGSQVGLWVIPIGLLVNIALLLTGVTRTMNVDIWNYWHFALIGALVLAATGSLLMGLTTVALVAALSLFFSDWCARAVQRFYGIPGVSVPHILSVQVLPIAIVINWLIERIPFVRDLDADADTVTRRLGVLGEPATLSFFLGLGLGLIAFLDIADPIATSVRALAVGVSLAAGMVLLPYVLKLLMEGLIPVTEGARQFVERRLGDREVTIGLDSSIVIGHPSAMASALILIPIAIALSVLLPGNRVLVFTDLVVIPFIVALAAPIVRGNVVRMVLIGTVTLTLGFYIATALAPTFTLAAIDAGISQPANGADLTAMGDGFVWVTYLAVALTEGLGYIGLAIFAALIGGAFALLHRYRAAMEYAAGATDPQHEE